MPTFGRLGPPARKPRHNVDQRLQGFPAVPCQSRNSTKSLTRMRLGQLWALARLILFGSQSGAELDITTSLIR
jgi:hypothetical protein